jgi:hypothetical protein
LGALGGPVFGLFEDDLSLVFGIVAALFFGRAAVSSRTD